MAEYRKASVFVQGRRAGLLSETESGYCFLYDTDYVENKNPAVSLTLPLQRDAYQSKVLFSFFDGLIPEGWLLDVVIRNWKIDESDRFGLLLAACRDCIGDVSIIAEEE